MHKSNSNTSRCTYHSLRHTQTHTHTETHTDTRVTHLEVSVYHPHLMAVEHGLQNLLDAMTACKQQVGLVSLNTSQAPPPVHSLMHRLQRLNICTHTHTHTHFLSIYDMSRTQKHKFGHIETPSSTHARAQGTHIHTDLRTSV